MDEPDCEGLLTRGQSQLAHYRSRLYSIRQTAEWSEGGQVDVSHLGELQGIQSSLEGFLRLAGVFTDEASHVSGQASPDSLENLLRLVDEYRAQKIIADSLLARMTNGRRGPAFGRASPGSAELDPWIAQLRERLGELVQNRESLETLARSLVAGGPTPTADSLDNLVSIYKELAHHAWLAEPTLAYLAADYWAAQTPPRVNDPLTLIDQALVVNPRPLSYETYMHGYLVATFGAQLSPSAAVRVATLLAHDRERVDQQSVKRMVSLYLALKKAAGESRATAELARAMWLNGMAEDAVNDVMALVRSVPKYLELPRDNPLEEAMDVARSLITAHEGEERLKSLNEHLASHVNIMRQPQVFPLIVKALARGQGDRLKDLLKQVDRIQKRVQDRTVAAILTELFLKVEPTEDHERQLLSLYDSLLRVLPERSRIAAAHLSKSAFSAHLNLGAVRAISQAYETVLGFVVGDAPEHAIEITQSILRSGLSDEAVSEARRLYAVVYRAWGPEERLSFTLAALRRWSRSRAETSALPELPPDGPDPLETATLAPH